MSTHTPDLRSRLVGLAATLALLLFLIGVPVLLLGIGATPAPGAFGWSALTAPDDGTLAIAVIAVLAWGAWAVFALSILLAIAAQVRGIQARRIPGLGLPQYGAGQLVAAAALLFVAAPTIATVIAAPRAVAAVTPADRSASTTATAAPTPLAAAHEPAGNKPAPTTETYVVKRGDSLWKIAQQLLGDPTRYTELEALNHHLLGDRPDFLTPGTVLRVPVTVSEATETYVVQPGDTLSGIAEHQLGHAADATEIFDASRDIEQTGGAHLKDMDLIRPGWKLAIPEATTSTPVPLAHRAEPSPTSPPPVDPTVAPATHTDPTPSWLVAGLTGAGTVLAGSLFLALRGQRRSQLRFRRPGRIPPTAPPEFRPVETTAWLTGTETAGQVEALDRALRSLALSPSGAPKVASVQLTDTHIDLTLAEAAGLPEPWTGTDTRWSLAMLHVPKERGGVVAPYPLLASLGQSDDGAMVLINLEQARVVALAGDTDQALALGRHIAAELVLNPWSTLVEVDTLGLGSELTAMDPSRCRHHTGNRFLDDLASDLQTENPTIEPDQYRAVIGTAEALDAESVGKLATVISTYPGRTAAALLMINGAAPSEHVQLRIDAGGRLTAEDLGIEVAAAGLTTAEAYACAQLIALTHDLTDTPVPASQDPAAVADQGGALAPTLTEPRPTQGPAGPASLLPHEAREYEPAGATAADLNALAPLATPTAVDAVREADPDLDDDLARWQAPRLLAPELTVLGPVKARTMGDASRIANRKPHYLALLTYLTLHPAGVTASQIARDFGYAPDRARNDLSYLRHWLGNDPRSGQPYLPPARQARNQRAEAPYVVSGVLSDLDLFRRLRVRGQSRGACGIDDLETALALVSGEPFSDMHSKGWAWLFEGERLDHIMAAAIVDTAHIVCAAAIADGDIERARWAAETGHHASPYDEVAQLDRHAVAVAAGDLAEAERIATEEITNRTDDNYGPLEPSTRTTEAMDQIAKRATKIKAVG